MTDYNAVKKALAEGADPAMLCMTCPWDRHCLMPPSMSRTDVENMIAEAKRVDRETMDPRGGPIENRMGELLTVVAFGNRDMLAHICPVLAMKFRLPEGKQVAELIKNHMQAQAQTNG